MTYILDEKEIEIKDVSELDDLIVSAIPTKEQSETVAISGVEKKSSGKDE